jgi:hypothetical protein
MESMGRMRIATGIIIVCILLLIAGALWWGHSQPSAALIPSIHTEEKTYQNTQYGYSFAYPSNLQIKEYTPEIVAIGLPTSDDGFTTVTQVDVSTTETGAASFEEYVFERSKTLCAADGPNESLSCDTLIRNIPFSTDSGLTGDELYLQLVKKTLSTGTTSTTEFGPIYALDIGANAPNSSYAALLIYQPLSGYLDTKDADAVTEVAHSLTVQKVEDRPNP